MVVCQYFLEGRCRFGANCRYEHPTTNNASSFLHHSKQFNDIMLEVISAERGNQWPLSCFAPMRDRPVVPNLRDTSPEELRWLFYEARQQGRMENYVHQARKLYGEAQEMRNFLKQPSAELGKLLENLSSNKIETDSKSSFRFSLGNENTQNIFGNTQPPPPPSYAPTENPQFQTNVFSQPNLFAQQNQTNFPQPTSTNIFGGPSQPPVAQPAQSVFQQNPTLFGNNVQQQHDQDVSKYSTELSEEDTAIYMAPEFTFGKIPQKPPTRSLC